MVEPWLHWTGQTCHNCLWHNSFVPVRRIWHECCIRWLTDRRQSARRNDHFTIILSEGPMSELRMPAINQVALAERRVDDDDPEFRI